MRVPNLLGRGGRPGIAIALLCGGCWCPSVAPGVDQGVIASFGETRLAADAEGNVGVLYTDARSGSLRMVTGSTTHWRTDVFDGGTPLTAEALAADARGGWEGFYSNPASSYRLYYFHGRSGSWKAEEAPFHPLPWGESPVVKMALLAGGEPVVAYVNFQPGATIPVLFLAERDSAGWTTLPVPTTSPGPILRIAITAPTPESLHIVTLEEGPSLHDFVRSGSTWSERVTPFPATALGGRPLSLSGNSKGPLYACLGSFLGVYDSSGWRWEEMVQRPLPVGPCVQAAVHPDGSPYFVFAGKAVGWSPSPLNPENHCWLVDEGAPQSWVTTDLTPKLSEGCIAGVATESPFRVHLLRNSDVESMEDRWSCPFSVINDHHLDYGVWGGSEVPWVEIDR